MSNEPIIVWERDESLEPERIVFRVTRAGALLVERPGDVERLIGRAPEGARPGTTETEYQGGNVNLRALLVPPPEAREPSVGQIVEALVRGAVPGICVLCGSLTEDDGLLCGECRALTEGQP